jgi:hypothetical protein
MVPLTGCGPDSRTAAVTYRRHNHSAAAAGSQPALRRPLGGTDPQRPPVGRGRHAEVLAEDAAQVARAHFRGLSEVGESEVLVPVGLDVGDCAGHGGMPAPQLTSFAVTYQNDELIAYSGQRFACSFTSNDPPDLESGEAVAFRRADPSTRGGFPAGA